MIGSYLNLAEVALCFFDFCFHVFMHSHDTWITADET